MNGTWRGPLRLPESARRITQYPKVDPLPKQGDPEPRRCRTAVCGHLTINNQYWTPDVVRLHMKDVLKDDKADIRCEMRPGVALKADYAQDCCLSSWSRGCPFKREEAA